MTHGSSDGRDGTARGDGSYSQREQRLALLVRASHAIHRAQAATQDARLAVGAAEEAVIASMETRALVDAEREAMRKLESDVRRFADALRTQGAPPEVAVRRLKATVDPVVYSSREHDAADLEWRRAVSGDVMRWFVEAYYAA